jgi:hypothetical protein
MGLDLLGGGLMSAVLARWRAAYTPGEWIVLSGPTSLVVLQPIDGEWSAWLGTIWEEVLASASLVDLAGRLAAEGLDEMPSFGAFFWTEGGMRSLIRGAVTVRDDASGAALADGDGIQTWTELGLGEVQRIRIETGSERAGAQQEPSDQWHLPLLVGAVRAATVVLDADPAALVRSPQGAPVVSPDREPELTRWPPDGSGGRQADTEDLPAVEAEMENGDTQLMQRPPGGPAEPRPELPEPTQPLPEPHLAAPARVVLSDGQAFDLTQPARIGRAPSAGPEGDDDLLLVTVVSRNQDISRSHVQLTPVLGAVLVSDLRSTNGTILLRPGPGSTRERLHPGDTVEAQVGSLLDLGDGVTILLQPPGVRDA